MVNLPYGIGSILRDKIDTKRIKNGLPEPAELKNVYDQHQTFLESELASLTSLTINSDFIPYLEYFPNLKNITIDSAKGMKQFDIQEVINKYPNLTGLTIKGQQDVGLLDLSRLKKLENLDISDNHNLNKILGLKELENLDSLKYVNNHFPDPTFQKEIFDEVLKLTGKIYPECTIDVLSMPSFVKYLEEKKIPIENNFPNLKWSESLKEGKGAINYVTYSTDSLFSAYKRATDIISSYIKPSDSVEQKYAILYQWMCENVKYDYDSVNSNNMSGDKFLLNGRVMRIVSGVAADANGTVTPFIKKACVCQGYTKAMQFLCKMVDIPVFDTYCAINTSKEETPHILFNEPDEIKANHADHSIQKINLNGNIYYSDLTWDANRHQKGLPNSKYFLLSYDDISKNHPFVNEQEPAIINKSASIDKRNELLSFARIRISSVEKSNQENKGISK